MSTRGRHASTLMPACAASLTAFCSIVAAVPAHADGDPGGALLNQINAMRAVNGCNPVAANAHLSAAAARHATDMLQNGVRSHVGSDGSSARRRATDAGYAPNATVGEVVFWRTGAGGRPGDAVQWWMNSPGHRAVITDCRMTEAGFSSVSNGDKMTVAGDFGSK